MKLLDKFKDLFLDEVIEDDEIEVEDSEEEEKVYQEPKKDVLPKVMREEIHEEERVILPKEKTKVLQEEKEDKVQENTRKFNFTFDFDEVPTRENKENELRKPEELKPLTREKEVVKKENVVNNQKKSSNLYPAKEENWVKPKFKASPVISPVYGVLDKNYTKEEVKERAEDNVEIKRPSKKVDFETVRKKAFGNLSEEIKDSMCENCELYKEAKRNSMITEDDLLYDMTVEEENKEVTIEKAYNNYEEFGVAYEPQVEKNIEEEEVKEVLPETVEVKEEKEVVPPEEIPSRKSLKEEKVEKNDDIKVDADFFELIDSMYKERSDD